MKFQVDQAIPYRMAGPLCWHEARPCNIAQRKDAGKPSNPDVIDGNAAQGVDAPCTLGRIQDCKGERRRYW